jgi:peptidoglycan/LPS O-acetylase OafA/YrhL
MSAAVAATSASAPAPGAVRYRMIDALRGIACLAVVFYHAKEGGHLAALEAAAPAWFGQLLAHGDSGVAVFFAISGFVIAHSMLRDEVSGRYVGRFLLRRSLRLDPPYWAAIALALAAAWLSARAVPGKTFAMPDAGNLLLHVTYLADLARAPLINPVYWTLCVEVQFYVSFVLLMWGAGALRARLGAERALDVVLAASALVAALWMTPWAPFHRHGLFLEHWYLFIAGVLAWRAVHGGAPRHMAAALANCALLAVVLGLYSTSPHDLVGLATVLLILVCGRTGWLASAGGGPLLQWLGLISYSLYLTHNTITGAAFRVGYRLTGRSAATEALWLALVVVVCCLFAWGVYLVFERAGLRWSKLVPLHRPPRAMPGAVGA